MRNGRNKWEGDITTGEEGKWADEKKEELRYQEKPRCALTDGTHAG